MKERGTVDMIFDARHLQRQCREQHIDIYTTCVDLTTFDVVAYGK